ncbi:ATP-binding cassette domain-containing protein [uncultured Microbacterium sp.]|uniref:ABC transporter ATP-binding protein n=1 Tax=uncultured Microbacterium sp. TaxID=191216 RepID=UPI0025E82E74|nr:ATP-binding cassette domain-containing protein [uncultured Microbacterium sp.]
MADPTPADVAVEEPVVEPADASVTEFGAVDASVAGSEPVSASAAEGEPVADPTPADVAVEEPVIEPTDASVSESGSVDASVVGSEPVSAFAAEPAAEIVTETPLEDDARTEVSSDIDGAAEPHDPTPADVRVGEVEPGSDESVLLVEGAATDSASDAAAPETAVFAVAPAETSDDENSDDENSDDSARHGDDLESAAVVAAPAVEGAAASDVETAVPALTLRTITKNFGELRAVDAIDLTVPAGAFYGLVGPNGAGKTTTLSIIAGLLRPDRGTVTINGVDAGKRSREAKKLIGVLPDRLRTFDRLTGRQLLSYYGALRGLPAPLVESRTADLARAFDLVEALSRPVSDYSAGMTKKVMLAGAMIHSPRLLVLDEPFEAVDPVSSGVILDILGTYVEHGGTVILSSHGMELVERVCSRVAVIVSGQVLAEGTVDEVRGEGTLEERFRELSGGLGDVEGLEWLHTFSA